MRSLALALFVTLLLLQPLGAEEPPKRYVSLAVDGAGATWLIERGERPGLGEGFPEPEKNVLLRQARGEAAAKPIEPLEDYYPVRLLSLRDGGVACLWFSRSPGASGQRPPATPRKLPVSTVVAFYRDGAVVSQSALPMLKPDFPMHERRDGSLVIATKSGVYLLPREGEAKSTRLGGDLLTPKQPKDAPPLEPLQFVEDEEGRLWFWSPPSAAFSNRPILRGFVTWEEGKLQRAEIAGLPEAAAIGDVLAVDAGHAWAAVAGQGVWVIDWRARRAEPLLRDAKAGPSNVTSLFACGETRYAVLAKSDDVAWPAFALCRFTGSAWEKAVENFDEVLPRAPRPVLATPVGWFVGRAGHGVWRFEKESGREPALLDWQRGVPVRHVTTLALEASGQVCARTETGVLQRFAPAPVPLLQPTRVQTFTFRTRLLRDQQGRLWGVDERQRFVRWAGEKWEPQPAPEMLARPAEGLAWQPDDRDRGWLTSLEGWVAICDFATGQWQTYADWETALRAEMERGWPKPTFLNNTMAAVRSAKGEILARNGFEELSYFDGQNWRSWPLRAIDPGVTSGDPYFAADGGLRIAYAGNRRAWDAASGQWQKTAANEKPPADFKSNASIGIPSLPPDSPVKASNAVRSDDGVIWASTTAGELYKVLPGRTVPAFAPGEANPFRAGDYLSGALTDARGGAFLFIYTAERRDWSTYHYLAPTEPPPTPATLQLVQQRADMARLRIVPVAKADAWYQWKLDELDWVPLQQEKEIVLQQLAAGPHRVQLRTWSAELATAGEPAAVEWKTEIMDPAALARAVSQLGSRSLDERRAAAALLRSQSTTALPLLKEARKTGPPDAQFWIEKVIGEIEADLQPASAVPTR